MSPTAWTAGERVGTVSSLAAHRASTARGDGQLVMRLWHGGNDRLLDAVTNPVRALIGTAISVLLLP